MLLISVIVPVYNVERYIRKCIDSILNQTYTNLEIILVDDGSTDGSGKICDEYEKSDSRIVVIHKKNAGLSAARNSGLEIAQGEYIGFVDSDDWIEPTMFSALYEGFEITTCSSDKVLLTNGMLYEYYEESQHEALSRPESWERKHPKIIRASDFGEAMLSESSNHYVWSKLYRREVFDLVRFREGRNDEDTLFTYELAKSIRNSDWIVVEIDAVIYHYRHRQGSICYNWEAPLIKDRIDNLNYIHRDCAVSWPELTRYVDILKAKTLWWNLKRAYQNSDVDINQWEIYQKMLKEIPRGIIGQILKGNALIQYRLLSCSPKIYRGVYILYNKRNYLKCRH